MHELLPVNKAAALAARKSDIRGLLLAALTVGRIATSSPHSYLKWAVDHSPFPVPDNLRAAVERRYGAIRTWDERLAFLKKEREGLEARFAEASAERERVMEERISAAEARARAAEECEANAREELAKLERERPRWPWGDYETENLRLLEAAVREFWLPSAPGEFSRLGKTVEQWLLDQGAPLRVAEVIPTIIADPTKRKKVSSKKP